MSAMIMIPLSEPGSDCSYTEKVAPGIFGYAMLHGEDVYVPYISAEVEGSGVVGKWIDSLPDHVCFPNVISSRLAGMLRRRGYRVRWEWVDYYNEWCDVYDKRLAQDQPRPTQPEVTP